MSNDPRRMVIVTESRCPSCSVHTVLVHHQTFPELRIEGLSAEKAAGHLVNRLGAALDSTLDPLHREAIQHASPTPKHSSTGRATPIPGVMSSHLLDHERTPMAIPHAYPGMPVDLRPAQESLSEARTTAR